MNGKPDLSEKAGTAINELDIDFSRFTLVGWLVSLISLGIGGGTAFLVCRPMVQRNGLDKGDGLAFFVVIVTVTVVLFMVLSRIAAKLEFPIVRIETSESNPDQPSE